MWFDSNVNKEFPVSMYDDVLNKLDDGLFVKVEPGKPVKLRILDHPKVSVRKFDSGDTATRFAWPVWDYNLKKVRILEQGKGIFKDIVNLVKTWPEGEVMPAPFDIVISREGTGQFDTKYTVSGVPHDGSMPPSNQLEMPKEVRGMDLVDVVAGGTVPTIEAGQKALPSGDVVVKDLDATQEVNLDEIPF